MWGRQPAFTLPCCPAPLHFHPQRPSLTPALSSLHSWPFSLSPHALNLPPGWLLQWSWWWNGVRTPQPGCRDPQWAPPRPSTSSPVSHFPKGGASVQLPALHCWGPLAGPFPSSSPECQRPESKAWLGVWGGGRCEALTNQVDLPVLLLPASTALYGGSADQGPRRQLRPRSPRSSMEFEHWTVAA